VDVQQPFVAEPSDEHHVEVGDPAGDAALHDVAPPQLRVELVEPVGEVAERVLALLHARHAHLLLHRIAPSR